MKVPTHTTMRNRFPYLNYALMGLREHGIARFLSYGRNFLQTKIGSDWNAPVSRPLSIDLAVTHACNLRCGFCELPGRDRAAPSATLRKPLAREDWLGIIADAAAIGSSSVTVTGGEPLLHPDLTEFIHAIRGHRMISHVTTNGWLLTETLVDSLVDAGLDGITLSLEGATAATHDAVVGRPGAFARLTRGIGLLLASAGRRRRPIRISLNTVLRRESLGEIVPILDLAQDLGVHQVTVNPVHPFAAPDDHEAVLCHGPVGGSEVHEFEELIAELIRRRRTIAVQTNSTAYLESILGLLRGKPLPVRCVAGHASLTIGPWGDYFACFPHFMEQKSHGNLRDARLRDFWNGAAIGPLRRAAAGCRGCHWNCQSEVNLLFQNAWKPWKL